MNSDLTELFDAQRGGDSLINWEARRWLAPSDITRPVVILIHGFTADGTYLTWLAEFLSQYNFLGVLYNYNSYRGIDQASKSLENLLLHYSAKLEPHGFAIVAHSMGGLVARHFARNGNRSLVNQLKCMAVLGTPNQGTLNRHVLSSMIRLGEYLTGPNPFARTKACLSSQQLTLNDSGKLISGMNSSFANTSFLPILSISGGREYLELGERSDASWAGSARNKFLQHAIGSKPNDGLVAESSSNITALAKSNKMWEHLNSYEAYQRTNHSYLVKNQEIALALAKWIQKHP